MAKRHGAGQRGRPPFVVPLASQMAWRSCLRQCSPLRWLEFCYWRQSLLGLREERVLGHDQRLMWERDLTLPELQSQSADRTVEAGTSR